MSVAAPVKDKYSINGLTYTKMGLIAVFSWLLWGDFVFTIMETVKPKVLPLFLMGSAGHINASMTITNMMMVVVPGITGLLIGPAVSFKSDRYRGKRGRRIPFITWTMPFLVIALIGIGLAPYYRDFFDKMGGLWFLSPKNATLLLIALFVVMFHVFDEFVNSVFWYLFADVVPEVLIGRFVALFRVVGILATAAFSAFVFPYAETHMQWIFLGGAVVYLFGFSLMCMNVKEGEYPPPDDLGENPSIIKQIKVYVSECFSHRVYIFTFLFTAGIAFAAGANAGMIIFQRDGIHLSMKALGDIPAIMLIVTAIVAYPAGWAVDKWHPIRITLLMTIPLILSQILAFFFLTDLKSYIMLEGGRLIFYSLYSAAGIPMLIMIFPKEKYGQFCSCNGMVKSTSVMIGGLFAGVFMDYMTNYSVDKIAFRWVYMWSGVFQVLALLFLWLMYRTWKNLGGDDNYAPPGSALAKGYRPKAVEQEPAFPTLPPEDEGQAEPA